MLIRFLDNNKLKQVTDSICVFSNRKYCANRLSACICMQINLSNPAQNEKMVEWSNYYSKRSNFMIDLYFLKVNFSVRYNLNGNRHLKKGGGMILKNMYVM